MEYDDLQWGFTEAGTTRTQSCGLCCIGNCLCHYVDFILFPSCVNITLWQGLIDPPRVGGGGGGGGGHADNKMLK